MQKFLLVFEKIIFILSWILLLFIPLYPKIPLFQVPKTFVAIRAEDFLIALTYLCWLIFLLLSGKYKNLLKDQIFKLMLLFFFIGIVSLFCAIFVTQTIQTHLGILHFLRRVEVMLFLPLFAFVVTSEKRFKVMISSLGIVVLLVGLYALGQQFFKFPVITTTTSELAKGTITYVDEWTRVNSTFAGHYDLAIFMVGVLSVISALFWGIRSFIYKSGIGILALLSVVVLIFTAARVSFFAAIVGIITSLILSGKRNLILIFLALCCIALAYPSNLQDRLFSTFSVLLNQTSPSYQAEFKEQEERQKLNIPTLPGEQSIASLSAQSQRIATASSDVAVDIVPGEPTDKTELGVYRSFAIRLDQEWPRAIRAFLKNPLLGSGYSSLDLATDNDYLRSLGEVGLLGTAAFILLILAVVKTVLKNLDSKSKLIHYFLLGTISLIVALAVNALFIDVFEASKVASLFWMTMGMAVAARRLS